MLPVSSGDVVGNDALLPLCSAHQSSAVHIRTSTSSPRLALEDHCKDEKAAVAATTLRALALVFSWYTMSTSLSLYNKKLLGKKYGIIENQPFPAPVMMSAVQFALQHFLARFVHWMGVKRMTPAGETATWGTYVRTILPNGVATGLDIGFSNASFALITLSFYTMCKSSAPLFLLLFAFLWGIEVPSWPLAGIVVIISGGLYMLVAGETEFDLLGFVLVMTAACLSGLRWTITQVSLQGGDSGGGHMVGKGSSLEVMERLTPVMSITTALMSLCFEPLANTWQTSVYFSTLGHASITLALVAIGGLLAFLMVWVEFQLISETSALTFMVAGVFKEIVTVMVAHIIYGDKFTPLNGAGLAVLLVGVSIWNWHKYTKLSQGRAKAQRPHRSSGVLDRASQFELKELLSPVGNAGKRIGRITNDGTPTPPSLLPDGDIEKFLK